MGLFDLDFNALPEHIDEPEEWAGKDDDQHWYTSWRKYVKPLFAYRLKRLPRVLWAKRGKGYWRFESDGKPDLWTEDADPRTFLKDHPDYYLSRNQYWCEWHKAVLWPLFFSFHRYKDPKDVIPVGERGDRDGKIQMLYLGAKRDPDVTWIPAFYPGTGFK